MPKSSELHEIDPLARPKVMKDAGICPQRPIITRSNSF
jgi:hypothetical protein